jgi:hypothetical protein
VVNFTPGCFSPEEKLRYPLNRRLGRPQIRYETFGEVGDLFPVPEFEPPDRLTCSMVTIVTELLRLLLGECGGEYVVTHF